MKFSIAVSVLGLVGQVAQASSAEQKPLVFKPEVGDSQAEAPSEIPAGIHVESHAHGKSPGHAHHHGQSHKYAHAHAHEHEHEHGFNAHDHGFAIQDLPPLGFGTWNLDTKNASDVVAVAIQTGYRHIDCAAEYGNEKEVGMGIKQGAADAALSRKDYWVTGKLWNDHHGADLVAKALDKTLSNLGLEYLDLYLMHWPVSSVKSPEIEYLNTWKAMTKLPTSKVRRIGISNFSPSQLTELLTEYPLNKPYNHQFELHPYLPQEEWLATHTAAGITVTAYSPLGNMNPTYGSPADQADTIIPALLTHPALTAIAAQRACTPAQVALAWALRRGYAVIPKAAHAAHMAENFDADARCVLDADAAVLAAELPTRRFNNPSKVWGVKLYGELEDSVLPPDAVDEVHFLLHLAKRFVRGWITFVNMLV